MHNRCLAVGLIMGVSGLLGKAECVIAHSAPLQALTGPACYGIVDNFTCPAEPTTPDTTLSNKLMTLYSDSTCFKLLQYDELPGQLDCSGVPIPLGAMFVDRLTFVVPIGGVTQATLTFRAKASPSGETSTDFIAFLKGSTYIAGANLRTLVGAAGTWHPNQVGTFSLELSNLPAAFGTSSIVQHMNDGDLGIVVGNQTGVDWICLQTCACPCKYDPRCDGVLSDVLDVVETINVAFRGFSPPAGEDGTCPKARRDVDASGAVDVLDVVKVINVAFRGQTVASQYVDPCAP